MPDNQHEPATKVLKTEQQQMIAAAAKAATADADPGHPSSSVNWLTKGDGWSLRGRKPSPTSSSGPADKSSKFDASQPPGQKKKSFCV